MLANMLKNYRSCLGSLALAFPVQPKHSDPSRKCCGGTCVSFQSSGLGFSSVPPGHLNTYAVKPGLKKENPMWFHLEIGHFPPSSGFNFLLPGVGAGTNLHVLSRFEEQLEKEGLGVCGSPLDGKNRFWWFFRYTDELTFCFFCLPQNVWKFS